MLEELERRNYSESTTRTYVDTVEDFARFFSRPPDQLGPEEIREFTAHMFRVRKLADNTVGQRVATLRFFFTKTLKRSWNIEETPYPKSGHWQRRAAKWSDQSPLRGPSPKNSIQPVTCLLRKFPPEFTADLRTTRHSSHLLSTLAT